MAKKLVHSFYYILYQPKGVPSSRENFSGTGGMLAHFGVLVLPGIVDIFSLDTQFLDPNTN